MSLKLIKWVDCQWGPKWSRNCLECFRSWIKHWIRQGKKFTKVYFALWRFGIIRAYVGPLLAQSLAGRSHYSRFGCFLLHFLTFSPFSQKMTFDFPWFRSAFPLISLLFMPFLSCSWSFLLSEVWFSSPYAPCNGFLVFDYVPLICFAQCRFSRFFL